MYGERTFRMGMGKSLKKMEPSGQEERVGRDELGQWGIKESTYYPKGTDKSLQNVWQGICNGHSPDRNQIKQ